MATNQELSIKVERLKNLLVAQATGGYADNDEYMDLRSQLVRNPRLKSRIPMFLQVCRNLSEFWDFIKTKYSTYRERRGYLRDEFNLILTLLETESSAPGDDTISGVLVKVDSGHVYDAWQKALERRSSDPDGAITAARTLLETVCKYILDECKITYDDAADLPKLYHMTSSQLNLSPSQHTEQLFKRILGSCQTIVDGLGEMRNKMSDAHGKGMRGVKPAPRHAELAVNLAGTMATFLISTWEARRQ
jgi:uncharacterized protein YfkK (UPF0435 family)